MSSILGTLTKRSLGTLIKNSRCRTCSCDRVFERRVCIFDCLILHLLSKVQGRSSPLRPEVVHSLYSGFSFQVNTKSSPFARPRTVVEEVYLPFLPTWRDGHSDRGEGPRSVPESKRGPIGWHRVPIRVFCDQGCSTFPTYPSEDCGTVVLTIVPRCVCWLKVSWSIGGYPRKGVDELSLAPKGKPEKKDP